MSLAFGRDYLAIPGPSVIPDRVLAAMHRPSPNIYEGDLIALTHESLGRLKALAGVRDHAAIYIANGHGGWEAALANMMVPGDRCLVLNTGRFGAGWAAMAAKMGIVADLLDFGQDKSFDLARVEAALREDRAHQIRAVLAVQTDTSSSVRNDIATLRAAIDATGHPALLAADCIASFGCDAFDMDALGADVMVAACQKGLMTPPGLAILFWNARAQAHAEQHARPSLYWDWTPRVKGGDYWQLFAGTAPTHHLFGLAEALKMIAEEGWPARLARHATLARMVWAAVSAWGAGGPLRLNIADPALRAHSVTTILAPGTDLAALRRWCEREAGLTLGLGLGFEGRADLGHGSGAMRIGHMGHVSAPMLLGALATIEAAMLALGIPHGPGGVAEAAKVAAGQG
jgi:alanine-glyoxylate transaminase/serine-glyoxylate transaminase/serine-pyruvate transaminase